MIGLDPVVDKLCQRWQTRRPEVAIITAVRSAFRDLDQLSIPINLKHLATRRKIVKVVQSPLPIDGLISSLDGETYTIELNKDHPVERQRYTFAHEIGHTFFFELEPNQPRGGFRLEDSGLQALPANRGEEHLCNVAAAEILMPDLQFREHARQSGLGASGVLALARDFKVSVHATARRLRALSPHEIIVVLWEKGAQNPAYHAVWQAGRSVQGSTARLRVFPSDPIFELFEYRSSFSQRRWASLGGPLKNYFVDGIRLPSQTNQRVLTVFILEKGAEALVSKRRSGVIDSAQFVLF